MKGLIFKDMLVLKKMHWLIYVLLMPFLFGVPYLVAGLLHMQMDEIDYIRLTLFPPLINLAAALMIVWVVIDSDDRCNWLRCCVSMPVSRRDYIIAKYHVVFRIVMVTVGLHYLINLIITTVIGGASVKLFLLWLGCTALVCLIGTLYGFWQVNAFIRWGKPVMTAMNSLMITIIFGSKFLLYTCKAGVNTERIVLAALLLLFIGASIVSAFSGLKWMEDKEL